MNAMQEKLLDILKWYDAFCRENNLKYYLNGGTMLGAMRHKGFIPWDDDIDVGMPRSDYERFARLFAENPPKGYFLETPDTSADDYYYHFFKLYDTSTTLIENTKYKIKRGIYIDIFPLDGIANTPDEIAANYKKIKKLYRLLLTRIAMVRKGRGFLKNLAVVLMRLVPRFIIDEKKLLHKLDKACAERSFDDYEFVGNFAGSYWEKEIMEKKFFGEPRDYEFEGITVKGVADAESYLTHIYGDWRKLPPKEKQVSNHDFIYMDLNKSYLEN